MKINPEQMRRSAGAAEEMLRALANRHRLTILCQLIDGERSVGELAAFLALRDSTVSQHLARLRRDNLVATRRESQTIWYAIKSEAVRRLVTTLYDIYCGPSPICTPAPRPSKTARRGAR